MLRKTRLLEAKRDRLIGFREDLAGMANREGMPSKLRDALQDIDHAIKTIEATIDIVEIRA